MFHQNFQYFNSYCQNRSTPYKAKLSAYSLESLKKEPTRLADEREANLTQTQDLAFKNYKTFIQTADCTRDVFSEFGQVESKLDSLLDALPGKIWL